MHMQQFSYRDQSGIIYLKVPFEDSSIGWEVRGERITIIKVIKLLPLSGFKKKKKKFPTCIVF